MAGVLDYFFIGPGEKKRNQAEMDKFSQQLNLDTEQKVKLMEAERLARNKVRDEEEARMMESLTRLNAQNDELMPGEGAAMTSAIAQKRMDEMRTAKGLAESSGNMNIFAQNQAARPMMGRLGETSALAGIGENEAGIAKNELSKRDAIARQARITEEAMADQNAKIQERMTDLDTSAMSQRLIPKQEMSLNTGYDAQSMRNVGAIQQAYNTDWTDIGKSLGDQARATSAVSREVVKRPDQSRTFYHAPPPRTGTPKVLSPVDMQMLAQMGLDPAMVQQMMLGNQTSAIAGRNAVPQAVSMPNPSANKGAKEGAVGNLFK